MIKLYLAMAVLLIIAVIIVLLAGFDSVDKVLTARVKTVIGTNNVLPS